jgi:hypothetical protein
MKKYLKFMMAAVTVVSLASCADELNLNRQVAQKGDLTGYLQSPTDGEETRVAYAPGEGYVWDDEDVIKVYTVDQLLYNNYDLIGGEGTTEGEFELQGDDKISGSTAKKYAVTEPEGSGTIYGISATDNGTALLTATVNPRYDWSDVIEMGDGTEKEAYKLPTPFWGEAKINGTKINVNFAALTSFIKLDLRRVPVGTQAIVLVSHEDYYTVAPKGDPAAVIHTGGGNEPLAGTMNAELVAGAALDADTRLVSHDTLRIDFDKVEEIAGEDKILYLPVPAQRYAKLDVLAVTTDNRAPYTWTEAEVLASWTDEEFLVGKTKGVYLDAEYEIDATDPEDISTIIAQRLDGTHDVRVRLLNEVDPGTIYILNNGQDQGLNYTNVEIIFSEKQTNPLDIVECPANIVPGGAGNIVQWQPSDPRIATAESKSKDKKQTVKLTFEKGKATGDLNIYCPESDIVLTAGATITGVNNIIASTTNNISGYEKEPYNMKKAAITIKGGYTIGNIHVRSDKSAVYAYEDDTEILKIHIHSEQPGDIRLTDALAGTITYYKSLVSNPAIYTTGAAAIKKIVGDQNNVKVHAYWTMKSLTDKAVRKGYEGAEVEDDENAKGVVYTAAQLQAMGLDKGLEYAGSAFTSGSGVLEYTVSKKVGFIWLGGEEFPWIGPQMGIMQPDLTTPVLHSNRQLVDPVYDATWDSFEPQKYTEPVSVNFNWVELRNMELTINDPYFDDPHKCCTSCGEFIVKVERDLGLIRCINSKDEVEVKNVRLNDVELVCHDPKINIPNVGSIVGRISATSNVTLDDNRVTNLGIAISGGNVGGHVGALYSQSGNVEITKSLSGLYGFTIGSQLKEEELLGWGNYNETNVPMVFVQTIGENIGGVVGNLLAPAGYVKFDKGVEVGLNLILASGYKNVGGNNAGGIVGNLAYGKGEMTTATCPAGNEGQFTAVEGETKATVLRGTVNVDYIWSQQAEKESLRTNASAWGYTGNNAGGFAGKAWAAQEDGYDFGLKDQKGLQMVADGTVNVQYLKAQNRYAGGLIGYNKQAEAAVNDHKAATFISCETNAKRDTKVTITDILSGVESVTGGLVGLQAMGDLVIGGGAEGKDKDVAVVEVDINYLRTSFAGGGLVGENLDDVDINTKYRADESSSKVGWVNALVDNWGNTWIASDFTGGYAGENPATLRMFCGSFDNLAGLVKEHFKVKNHTYVAGADGKQIGGIKINGLIPDATKKALLFQLHNDPKNTKGWKDDPYWGDHLGYVGYADQTSFYLLEGTDYRQGDQEFNYRTQY